MALLSVSALGLSACVSPTAGRNGLYASPIGNAPVVSNSTPYSPALVCLASYAQRYGDDWQQRAQRLASHWAHDQAIEDAELGCHRAMISSILPRSSGVNGVGR